MKQKKYLEKIKSKYILESIFIYIKEEIFKLNLFMYSKYFQGQFNIKFIHYQVEYLTRNGINFNNYLFHKDGVEDKEDNITVYKDFLKNNLKEDLSKFNLDLNIIQKFDVKYFSNNKNKNEEIKNDVFRKNDFRDDSLKNEINIYSPFLN